MCGRAQGRSQLTGRRRSGARCGSGRTWRAHRRMNRRAATQHRRPQRNGSRFVFVFGLFGFDRWSGGSLWNGWWFRLGDFGCAGTFRAHRWRLLDYANASFRSQNIRSQSIRGGATGRTRFSSCLVIDAFAVAFLFSTIVFSAIVHADSRPCAVTVGRRRERGMRFAVVVPPQLIGLVFVDRARVGDFFGDAEFVQLVDDLARLHFQLPRQLIDSNLTHS
jgi:hypothetical protein